MIASPAFLTALLLFVSVLSAQGEVPNEITIGEKKFWAHSARFVEGKSPRVDLYVAEENFWDLGEVIGGMRKLEMPLADGQIVFGRREGSSIRNKEGGVWKLASFPVNPGRDKMLTARFRYADRDYSLTYANPAFRETIPEWQPQELPLTWTKGELAATLLRVSLVHGAGANKSLAWNPVFHWDVRWKGQEANHAFHIAATIEDPLGNQSADGALLGVNAWRVKFSIGRSQQYPFSKEELHLFGRIHAERFKSIPPGECDLLEIGELGRRAGIQMAGYFGPGVYEFDGGKLIHRRPPLDGEKIALFDAEEVEGSERVILRLEQSSFVHQLGARAPGAGLSWREVWRNPSGKPVFLGGQGRILSKSHVMHSDVRGAGGKSFDYGIADFGERDRFEFFIRPPQVPKQ